MSPNDKNTVNTRPKRANAGKNTKLEDFSVFGLTKKLDEEKCPRKRRKIATDLAKKHIPPPVDSDSDSDSDATTEMSDSDDSASTQSDPMEGIEPAEGTISDEKRNFKCDMCDMFFTEEDIHEDRNVTDDYHLLCHGCFKIYERKEKRREENERIQKQQRAFEEVVWPEDAQTFSRNPAHFDMTQPQYPEKSITSGIIDLTIAPNSGAFWKYESDSNLIVID